MWIWFLVFGYGLIFYGLRDSLSPPDLPLTGALYFAGTTLLTIGFGDVVPKAADARALAIVTGATGFAVVGLVTAYIFLVFGAFQRREAFILEMSALAGSPPSGVEIIETSVRFGMTAGLPTVFLRARSWSADLLETHLAYPILAFFRSNHRADSWIGTLGAVLDAATILISVDEGHHGQAQLLYRLGRHMVEDMNEFFGLPTPRANEIERAEFDRVYRQLASSGYKVVDGEQAWKRFSELRSFYVDPLETLARFWHIPSARWLRQDGEVSSEGGLPEKV